MRARSAWILMTATLLLTSVAVPALADGSMERSPVVDTADGDQTGTSLLRRSESGIRARLTTGGLTAGDAYTVWAVVFNNPSGCDDECDGADLSNPAAEAVSLLGAGGVARADHGTFVVRIRAGAEVSNPAGAEVHLIVRTHGPAIPGLVGEQTSTLNGGCPPNACANILMAKHG